MKLPINLKQRRAKGFTLAELTVVTAILGMITYYGAEQQEVKNYTNKLTAVEKDIEQLQLAYNQFYIENRRAPANIQELASEGFYTGSLESPFGTNYVGMASARGYQFSVDASDSKAALALSERLPNAAGTGSNNVSYSVPIPALSTISSQYLHRTAVAGSPELNQMQTSLDMNGFDIQNVRDLETGEIQTDRIDVDEATVETLSSVDHIEFGVNSISSSGNSLTIDADTVNVSNNLSINGDLTLFNKDISGVGTFVAEKGNIDTIIAETVDVVTGNVENLTAESQSVTNFDAINATIDSATVENLEFVTASGDKIVVINADIQNVDAQTAKFDNAQIDTLITKNFEAEHGEVTDLTSYSITTQDLTVTDEAVVSSANIDTLNSQNATVINITANNGTMNSATIGALASIELSTENLVTGNLKVNGTSTLKNADIQEAIIANATIDRLRIINDIVAENAVFNTASGDRIDFTNLVGDKGTFETLQVNGTLSADTANIDQAEVGTLSSTNFTVTGTTTMETANATNANISNTLTSRNITGQKATFSGDTTVGNLTVNSLNMNSFNIDNMEAKKVLADEVQGSSFKGGSYYASGDFRTSAGNSINSNKALYDSINNLWNSCVAADGCK